MSEILRKSTPDIVAEATARQRAASDPAISSWVGASAGSGKTKVLTDRMLRLLLPREDGRPGTPPEKILALTFTKAGANEMAQRLSKQLSSWAVMDTAELAAAMEKDLFGRVPTQSELEEARKLFARVVDTPGGMKIMTIHSFCQSILGRFPIEAGLNPNFKPLEEDHARELLAQAKKSVLMDAGRNPSSPLGIAVANISAAVNEEQFDDLLASIVGERNQFRTILKKTFGVDGFYTNLCAQFEIPEGSTEEEALQDFCAMKDVDTDGLRLACAVLLASTKPTDNKKGAAIEGFLAAATENRAGLYDDYKAGFIAPSSGEPYAHAATKESLDKNPAIENILQLEAVRILDFEDKAKKIACANISHDLFRVGDAVLEKYRIEKSQQGALDFDDLILKTLDLLRGDVPKFKGLDATPWIMYKLDEGLDHILVDEAQDTNPEQWDIIRLLAEEFFTGEGARDVLRTLFVVGDEKQSIFSFQRAAPERFDEMHHYFEKKIRDAGHIFRHIDINTSFRSTHSVLDAVDRVFSGGPDLGTRYLNHIAKREGQAGMVEIWPVFRNLQKEDAEDDKDTGKGWHVPDKIIESQSGAVQMAGHIAKTIASWIENGEKLESYDRPVRAGDILILVRSRGAFVGQLVRALKKANVAVSGVDRMVLEDQIVIQDLCAAASFALLPEDDLTLACLLKSPFIGMDEKTLYDISYQRAGSLWESLNKKGDREIIVWLEQLIARAGAYHPYEFFSRILQESCPADEYAGMRSIRRRLGDDALDPIDEFLNIALSYESSHTSGLQGFLKWLEEDNRQIKRELDEGGSAVRIMTVHGAKGLQAPIVILPDTIRTKSAAKPERVFWPHRTNLELPFYVPSKESAPAVAEQARHILGQKAEEEYRRLLYVAMTRAEERLYVGGYIGKRGPSANSKITYWYDDIRSALAAHPDIQEIPSSMVVDDNGKAVPILRLSQKRTAPPDNTAKNKTVSQNARIALPAFATLPAPAEPAPPRPLAPSRPSEEEPAATSPLVASQEYRFKRGMVTHKLLQLLPALSPSARRAAAEKFLSRTALALPPALQKNIATEVMAILEHPVFGDIFGPASMAEIPLTGMVDGNVLVSGQIDRLLVTDTDILIIDYKTNRPPPQRLEDVPQVYLRQLDTYAKLLKAIYPGRDVRAALLWTDGANLMEIPV